MIFGARFSLFIDVMVVTIALAGGIVIGLTYVFISHDLSVVRCIADRVMMMYFGEAVEYGARDAVFVGPQHAYTKTLFAATPRANVESIRARLTEKPAAT